MQTYEYQTIVGTSSDELTRKLNHLGDQGFRLVTTAVARNGFTYCFLERAGTSEQEIEEIIEQVEGMIHPVPLTPDPSLMDTERRGL